MQIVGKHKDKVLYRGIGGVQEEHKEAYSNRGIFWEGKIVTGRMRSDRSSSIRRLAGCNYGGNGGRVLIMAAMAAAQLN